MTISRHAVVAIVLASATCACAETVFKVATIAPDNTTWLNELRAAGKSVAQETEGRVKFKYYPGGVMGDDQAVIRKMRAGQLQGGIVLTSVFAKRAPAVQVFTLPLHFENYEEIDLVRSAMDQMVIEELEEVGYICFGLSEIGFAYAMSTAPIQTVEQIRKRKFWIPKGDQGSQNFLASFGITPKPLSPIDVLTGLQTGLIDTVASSPSAAIAMQWHGQVDYLLDVPLLYLYGVFVVNKRQFDRLSPEDQEIVRNHMGHAAANAGTTTRSDNTASLAVIESRGVKVLTPSEEEVQEWKAIAKAVKAELLESGKAAAELYARLERETERARAERAQ